VRDLVGNARINWELPWAKVPTRDKAMLFEAVRLYIPLSARQPTEVIPQAREQNPFLARFNNDWATEELVKQYTKNK
jgi:hypothetical protein